MIFSNDPSSLPNRSNKEFNWVVGLRNSHNKSLPTGLVSVTQVLVCDNLAFNGEVKLIRKHTRFAMRDLKQLTAIAVGKLGDKFKDIDRVRGLLIMDRLQSKNVVEVTAATIARLIPFRNQIHAITSHNGKEIAAELEIDFYFARPYHSWK